MQLDSRQCEKINESEILKKNRKLLLKLLCLEKYQRFYAPEISINATLKNESDSK